MSVMGEAPVIIGPGGLPIVGAGKLASNSRQRRTRQGANAEYAEAGVEVLLKLGYLLTTR
jgi:hypothetical protein